MKRKGWPIWLLRDVPAFLGVMLSFWPLVILLISSERRVMRGKAIRRSVFETIALLLAHAEARLTFALTRQAYRRLGWNPRLVRFNLIPATYNLREAPSGTHSSTPTPDEWFPARAPLGRDDNRARGARVTPHFVG